MSDVPPPQGALPSDDQVIEAFRGIFERRYFANHGPLVRAFDAAIAEALSVRHAVCVVNGTVALAVAIEALLLRARGAEHRRRPAEIIISALAPAAVIHAVRWGGASPVLCDIAPEGLSLAPSSVEALIGPDTAGILESRRWGLGGTTAGLEALSARHGLILLFDSAEAMGCTVGGRSVGGFGDAETFSLRPSNIVHSLEGGVVTTNDDRLADDLRTIRSFHAGETFSGASLRMNAKMSEAQAAVGLLSLAELGRNRDTNRRRRILYEQGLAGLEGVTLLTPAAGAESNHQDVVMRMEPSRRTAVQAHLAAAGLPARSPALFAFEASTQGRRGDLAVAERLTPQLLQAPNAAAMSDDDVQHACALIRQALNA